MKVKYSFFSSVLVFLLLNSSCDNHRDKFVRNYILENSTQHKIELKFYNDGTQYYVGDNILSNQGEMFVRHSTDSGPHRASALSAFQDPDSLVIIFDDIRKAKIVWDGHNTSLEGIDKNLLSDEAYIIENNENYRYVISEEDYNNAIEF